jgi:ADP-ribose pyrophosphatase YjhB (NUDIX family)
VKAAETALERELREEVAATADVHSLVYVLDRGGHRPFRLSLSGSA